MVAVFGLIWSGKWSQISIKLAPKNRVRQFSATLLIYLIEHCIPLVRFTDARSFLIQFLPVQNRHSISKIDRL